MPDTNYSPTLTSDDTDGNLLAQVLHKGHHVVGDFAARHRERAVHVKESQDARVCGGHDESVL